MARMIDADRLLRELTALSHGQVWPGWTYDGIRLLIERQPTLTQPNEWVKVMEAINNAAVAYIEGGPYDNDLPGMEFALKIDRLSRDFVRPPVGEEEEKHVIEITENF